MTIAAEKQEAEAALAEAIPALLEAEAALNSIKRDDITEIRSFAKPHVLVQQARLEPDHHLSNKWALCIGAWSPMLIDALYETVLFSVIPCLLNSSEGAHDCSDTEIM